MRSICYYNLKTKKTHTTLLFITVGIGFKLFPVPSHQWTPDVYEGVRFFW